MYVSNNTSFYWEVSQQVPLGSEVRGEYNSFESLSTRGCNDFEHPHFDDGVCADGCILAYEPITFENDDFAFPDLLGYLHEDTGLMSTTDQLSSYQTQRDQRCHAPKTALPCVLGESISVANSVPVVASSDFTPYGQKNSEPSPLAKAPSNILPRALHYSSMIAADPPKRVHPSISHPVISRWWANLAMLDFVMSDSHLHHVLFVPLLTLAWLVYNRTIRSPKTLLSCSDASVSSICVRDSAKGILRIHDLNRNRCTLSKIRHPFG